MDVGSVSTNSATSNAIEGLKKASSTIANAAQNIAGGSQDPQDIVSLSTAAHVTPEPVSMLRACAAMSSGPSRSWR